MAAVKGIGLALALLLLQACSGPCGARALPGSLGSRSCNQSCTSYDENKRTGCRCQIECPCWRKHQ